MLKQEATGGRVTTSGRSNERGLTKFTLYVCVLATSRVKLVHYTRQRYDGQEGPCQLPIWGQCDHTRCYPDNTLYEVLKSFDDIKICSEVNAIVSYSSQHTVLYLPNYRFRQKFQFGNGKSANWKLVTRKFQFGNGKSANWKSVMGNFQIGNRKQSKSVIDMAPLGHPTKAISCC